MLVPAEAQEQRWEALSPRAVLRASLGCGAGPPPARLPPGWWAPSVKMGLGTRPPGHDTKQGLSWAAHPQTTGPREALQHFCPAFPSPELNVFLLGSYRKGEKMRLLDHRGKAQGLPTLLGSCQAASSCSSRSCPGLHQNAATGTTTCSTQVHSNRTSHRCMLPPLQGESCQQRGRGASLQK